MKKVTLESVTGQQAEQKSFPQSATPTAAAPEISHDRKLEEAANEATHGVFACFVIAGLFLINGLLALGSVGAFPLTLLAAEAESTGSLFVMAILMAGGGYFALKRSRPAMLTVCLIYSVQSLWVLWLLYTYGPTVWETDFRPLWDIGRSAVVRVILICILWRGYFGLGTYRQLELSHDGSGAVTS